MLEGMILNDYFRVGFFFFILDNETTTTVEVQF